jgi:type II secretory pathway pseudopilin PulG
MSETAIIALIGLLVTAIVAPAVTLFLNRNKDGTSLAQNALAVANQAVSDLKEANKEIQILKDTRIGPIHIHIVATLDPLAVTKATINLSEEVEK